MVLISSCGIGKTGVVVRPERILTLLEAVRRYQGRDSRARRGDL